MTADITLRGPDEVIAVLPYQLGYHLHDCVVAVALRGRTMGMVARADLPPDELAEDVAGSLVGPLLRDGASAVVVVAWEDVADASAPVTLALVEALERAGVEVLDVAVVRDGRRYSPGCSPPCCPADGEPLRDPTTVPAVADLVALGRAPLEGRDAVARLVDPGPGAQEVGRVVAHRATRRPGRRRWARAWAEVLAVSRSGPPRPEAVADAVLSLADVPWRDGVVAWLSPGVLPFSEVDDEVLRHLRSSVPRWFPVGGRPAVRTTERPDLATRLVEVCRAVPDSCSAEAVAVCTVTAHVAWAEGDGALARAALDRAERLDPGYRLAHLLRRLVDAGVRIPRGRGRPRGGTELRPVG
ncbi:DUF4192 domain-containing protein [Oryzobacter sp. R7]|uniref:DUF4192 domain-containing protein n=1 Tax=Oryzobacter faecalis TaxID=3388656 RepID=UPI00398CF89C